MDIKEGWGAREGSARANVFAAANQPIPPPPDEILTPTNNEHKKLSIRFEAKIREIIADRTLSSLF